MPRYLSFGYATFALIVAVLFSSCASNTPNEQQKLIYKQEKKEVVKKIVKRHKGTLYSQAGTSLFADKKDLYIGDIIKVNIDENLITDSSNKKDLSKASNTVTGLSLDAKAQAGFAINSQSKSTFKGGISNKVNEKFQATMSAVIKERYTNGNYLIVGHSQIVVDGQNQQLELSGIIRPYDITSDNVVASSQIANLVIKYSKTGTDSASATQPWGVILFNYIWPF